MRNESGETLRRAWMIAAALMVLGAAARLAYIGALPFGLNQDEASSGYEAWALLHSGMDRCGRRWPVLFISWGSGQNVLMSYLAIPFVALLGLSELSIRLPNALFGCLTLVVFWRLARRCGGERFGLLALGLLAINPWHIMMSRWALESNLFPFFLLTGVWLTVVARERPWALTGAAASFALSIYAYGTAFFFLPLYLILALVWLRKDLRLWPFVVSLALFLVLALPIALCQLLNVLGMEELSFLGVTLPRLTEGRQSAVSVFAGGGFSAAMENFRTFLRMLWRGGDGLSYNALSIWRGGIFYFFGLPTALVGVGVSLFCRKDRAEEGPLRIALLSGLLCAFLIRGNINRLNMLWLPLIYFSAVGCHALFSRTGRWAALPILGAAACFLIFLNSYASAFGGEGNAAYFPGLGEAIAAAEAEGETVYVTARVNQPYIFTLFYTKTPPEAFAASVEYADPDAAFRQVRRYPGFEFRDRSRADVLVLSRDEAEDSEILYSAGSFVVCRGAP